jgi:hypothetical protein
VNYYNLGLGRLFYY